MKNSKILGLFVVLTSPFIWFAAPEKVSTFVLFLTILLVGSLICDTIERK